MVSTSDAIALAGLAFTAGGAFVGTINWFIDQRKIKRRSLPIIRYNGERVVIENRINEDISVSKIETDGLLLFSPGSYDIHGVFVSAHHHAAPEKLNWKIPAQGSGKWPLWFNLDATFFALTISSSDRTIRDKRMIVHLKK